VWSIGENGEKVTVALVGLAENCSVVMALP
jgi:hypothetical protein